MLNEESQHILLAGESNSGKTTNMLHLVEHLMFLGKVSPARPTRRPVYTLALSGSARHRGEGAASDKDRPRVYERVDAAERQLHQMHLADTDDLRVDRQGVRRDILAVPVGKVARFNSRQVICSKGTLLTP